MLQEVDDKKIQELRQVSRALSDTQVERDTLIKALQGMESDLRARVAETERLRVRSSDLERDHTRMQEEVSNMRKLLASKESLLHDAMDERRHLAQRLQDAELQLGHLNQQSQRTSKDLLKVMKSFGL